MGMKLNPITGNFDFVNPATDITKLTDNVANALAFTNGGDDFMIFDTTNSSEALEIKHDIKLTVGKKIIFDAP